MDEETAVRCDCHFRKRDFPGVMELLKKYQERAPVAGTDPLRWYIPMWAYADLQALGQAIAAMQTLYSHS